MKFKALEVQKGDSFLLEKDDFVLLVDGGNNRNTINQLIKKYFKGNLMDVLICTHYHVDHFEGLIGILKSNLNIKEVWLPDILGDIAYTISDGTIDLYDIYSNITNKEIATNEKKINYYDISLDKKEFEGTSNIKNDKLSTYEIIDFIGLSSFIVPSRNFNYFQPFPFAIRNQYLFYKIQFCISKISELIYQCHKKGIHIRWLKYYDRLIDKKIKKGYNINALNSIEVPIKKYKNIQKLLDAVLFLSKINQESLVFLFDEEGFPNVLFTSDSDLSFIKKGTYRIKDKSIVTAPHHGAKENKEVYRIVNGNDLIYIRSDNNSPYRPCKEYTMLPKKYCTICRNSRNKVTVALDYNRGKWITNNIKCTC